MKANELRIGNYVLGNVFNSKEFLKTTIERTDFCDLSYLRKCKPIPLTEEWLIKFGFVKSLDYWVISNKGFFVGITLKEVIYPMFDIDNPMLIKTLKHVHQLQNLYFALTGEELTIKEDETKK